MNAPVLMENTPRASALGNGALTRLPLDCIDVQDDFNPRRFFEDTEFAALVRSVRRQGVLQAVWVRPQADFDPHAPRFWLIAGLPPATQDGTLAKILSDVISVVDLKTRIKGFALDLSVAFFDKTDCATCPHHSTLQGVLFAEAVEGGRCQNRACFHQKTQAALQARQAELTGDYPTVFLDTERPADTSTALTPTGSQGAYKCRFFWRSQKRTSET